MQGSITGQELLDQARADLTEVERAIREHPFLDALESGRAPRSVLEALAGEQQLIIPSDRRSFAQLAARFPADPPGRSSCRWPRAKAWRSDDALSGVGLPSIAVNHRWNRHRGLR